MWAHVLVRLGSRGRRFESGQPTVFGLVRGKFGPGGGLWDRLEFHENFNGPLPEHTEPARSGPGSQLGGWDVGGQVNGQRVAEEGCRVSRCDPGPVRDQGQRVPDALQPHHGDPGLTAQHREPVRVRLWPDRSPSGSTRTRSSGSPKPRASRSAAWRALSERSRATVPGWASSTATVRWLAEDTAANG
jgi:hypothetical protein